MGNIPVDWAMPEITATNRVWFTGGALAVQCCVNCSTRQHPPEEVCHRCGGIEFEHANLGARGTVHSYTIVHHPANPALAGSVPYAVVLVRLDDDPEVRVIGNMPDTDPATLRIGMRVAAYWEERFGDDGAVVLLPQWRPDGE